MWRAAKKPSASLGRCKREKWDRVHENPLSEPRKDLVSVLETLPFFPVREEGQSLWLWSVWHQAALQASAKWSREAEFPQLTLSSMQVPAYMKHVMNRTTRACQAMTLSMGGWRIVRGQLVCSAEAALQKQTEQVKNLFIYFVPCQEVNCPKNENSSGFIHPDRWGLIPTSTHHNSLIMILYTCAASRVDNWPAGWSSRIAISSGGTQLLQWLSPRDWCG